MKRNLITIQFIEDGLIILNQNELKEYSLKSVNNHQVINKELFIQEFSPIIESNKINNKIFTDNLNIIIDSSYSNFYLSNLEQLFKELSFNKIEFINRLDIIKLNNEKEYARENFVPIIRDKSSRFLYDFVNKNTE